MPEMMIEVIKIDEPNKEMAVTLPKQGLSERRKHVRYQFTASVEAVEPRTGTRITGRVSDLSLGGCYIDTISPFAGNAALRLCITKDQKTFRTMAKVANSQASMGMGVSFTSVEPGQVRILENWIGLLSGALPDIRDTLEQEEQVSGEEGLKQEGNLILSELIIVLMRKKVLNEGEGLEMIKNLHR